MLPIIDLSPLRHGDDAVARERCASDIHRASTDIGFFVAVGHGIDDLIDAILDASRRFFALPQPIKEGVPRLDRYGYVPHATTAIDTTRQSLDTEFMDLGLANEVELPELAGLEWAVRNYQSAALGVSAAITSALASALGLEPDFFAASMATPQCRLRLLRYPPVEPTIDATLPVPMNAHTDYGLITLLATDGVPGLEVRTIDGDWMPVNAAPGSLVINLGDMLARWTNDVYKSTPHRVVGSGRTDRYSIPFFVNPDPDTTIECIPTCVSDANPCRYEPVTAGDFLEMRIDGTVEPYVDPQGGPVRMAPSHAEVTAL